VAAKLAARGWLRPERAEAIISKAVDVGPAAKDSGSPKTSTKRRLLYAATVFAVLGTVAGVIGLVVQSEANKTQTQADQTAAVLSSETSTLASGGNEASKEMPETGSGPTSARLQGFLDAQNLLASVDQLGTDAQKTAARKAAAEFVSPDLLSSTGVDMLISDPDWTPTADQAASGVTPLSLGVEEVSGSIKFGADPACVWTAAPSLEDTKTTPVTLALCHSDGDGDGGQGQEIYGWAELSWTGDGDRAQLSAVHVGWSSAHLRQVNQVKE
jgi:hypothetical protein